MKRIIIAGGIAVALVFSSITLQASVGPKLDEGVAEVLYDFAPEISPEGIALDRNGNIFVGLRTVELGVFVENEIIKITPWGDISVLADFGPAAPGAFGALGLTSDPKGNVYLAFASFNVNHGVYKICPDGEMERLAGSAQIILPNSLTFDKQGNLYCTDSDPLGLGNTGVWKYGKEEQVFEPWAGDPLLLTGGTDPDGNPMVGANGIVFDPPNHIYVANTQRNLIAHVTVLGDGSAGEISPVAGGPPLLNPDGLACDAHGNVYTVIPISTFPDLMVELFELPPLSPVIRIIPETGEMQPVLAYDFPDREYFDFPTSLAFGIGPLDKKSVFVVGIGMASYNMPPGTGTKLTQVGVGVPGQK